MDAEDAHVYMLCTYYSHGDIPPPQDGKTPLDLADTEEVKAAFADYAESSDITDGNKNRLLLLCARLGFASRLSAVLKAGANAAHTDKVRVRA